MTKNKIKKKKKNKTKIRLHEPKKIFAAATIKRSQRGIWEICEIDIGNLQSGSGSGSGATK